jgi:hypothetical protein
MVNRITPRLRRDVADAEGILRLRIDSRQHRH